MGGILSIAAVVGPLVDMIAGSTEGDQLMVEPIVPTPAESQGDYGGCRGTRKGEPT